MSQTPITAWLKPPSHSRGLDPLGVQAPAINIYGQLLPGITNVTDRARYYSFYPWVIRTFENTVSEKSYEKLKEWVRRSDCLFSMIGIRHGQTSGDKDTALHTRALTGSNTLTSVVHSLEDNKSEVDLSKYTHFDASPSRYFQNNLGGLGQYYIGTFDSLGLMTRQEPGVANTNEVGVRMAEAMDSSVNTTLFIETIKSGKVSRSVLDKLVDFCPCQLRHSGEEHSMLLDLFFARNMFDNKTGIQRRNTLGLILNLIQNVNEHDTPGVHFNQDIFRSCSYTGTLPDGSPWSLPQHLEYTRSQWSAYQKHELLSSAIQSIFWIALRMIEETSETFWSTEEFIRWFSAHRIVIKAAEELGDKSFSVARMNFDKTLPDYAKWRSQDHEMQLVQAVLSGCSERNPDDYTSILVNAGHILLTLLARNNQEPEVYSPLHFPEDFFRLYPLNLQALRQKSATQWNTLSTAEWLSWIAGHWGIEAHFRVALRKLRFQNKDTLHILPTDHGLVVQEMPSPTYTTPRFSQAVQILEDLGAITKTDSHTTLTSLGETLRGEIHA